MTDSAEIGGSELGGAFVRHLVSRAIAQGLHNGAAGPDVDWEAMWPAASGQLVDDGSIGRAVVRAFQVATGAVALPTRRRTWVTVFTWVQNYGFIILLFVAWQLWGTSIAQHDAQSQLRNQFQSAVTHHPGAASKPASLLPASAAVRQPTEGSGVARLQIPALGLDQIVVAGTSTGDLSKGPGHYTGTALPGQEGNVAIAGHRTTDGAPFNRLGQLVVGDRVILTTTSGEQLIYLISAPPVAVSPSDVAVLNNFGDNRVTLTTCTPEFSASQRLIAVGEFERGSAGVPQPASTTKLTTYHVVDSDTASWNLRFIPLVLLEGAVLIGLGLLSQRIMRWLGRIGHWALVLPLWLLGLFLLFQSLTSLLPASV